MKQEVTSRSTQCSPRTLEALLEEWGQKEIEGVLYTEYTSQYLIQMEDRKWFNLQIKKKVT